MKSQVKVSVIIPVYNVEEYLEDCLNSLLKQTLKEIEIICVDDGATDASPLILEEFEKKDSRIKVIHQKNAGAGVARNIGVSQAQGEYIGFVDSDDIVYPTMYSELYAKAKSCLADMVITGEVDTAVGEAIRFPIENFERTCKILELDQFNAVDYPEIVKNMFLWNRIYKRTFWKSQNFQIPEGRKFAEDMLICTQTTVLAARIGYVKGPLYWYRNQRENSLSDTLAKSSKKLDYIKAVKETKEFLQMSGKYSVFQTDFLAFALHLFAMLQSRIADYSHFREFFSGMESILDEKDFKALENTWIKGAYPDVLITLKRKAFRKHYCKNRIRSVLHIN